MNTRRGNLKPAHRGYRYQDIATAYLLVRSVTERFDEVIVDHKQVEDDRIDDVEVRMAGQRCRRQFKSSEHASRLLSEEDFVAVKSSLRIDRLVLTHVRDGSPSTNEYRLCATWAPPAGNDALAPLLEPITADPTLVGWPARFFRIRGDGIWPAGGPPIWAPLLPYAAAGAEFGRAEVLDFCERFVLELALPISSSELAAPGPLENALVQELGDHVGIGRYPNHGRSPVDVAALAISLANLARTQGASLSADDVERELEIRVDFGRVAQAFPLDPTLFHDRPRFRGNLRDAALAGHHQLVVAPPGAGKSWELTRLAEELQSSGAIVARHYCYLEPGDDQVERRVTTDVFFANLLGELLDADPTLRGAGGARYAAGIAELEATLYTAAASGRPVVLVVDGLDHIARVRADARGLAADDTDIVERLATVNVPPGVALLVGSQPGHHLDPLRAKWGDKLALLHLPPWQAPDLAALADRHGVSTALETAGLASDDAGRLRDMLAERADGNPLYARYLARGLVAGLRDGTVAAPEEWITAAPATAGDITVYYSHLYRNTSTQAQAIADLLGMIDFAVTERELREMVPALFGGWVPQALVHLESILTSATGQGGVRVFHESFRRFMTQELARQGRSIADALAPVIAWLSARGFYEDAKAFRFLLPALRRAGRRPEVLAQVPVSFVSDSVAQAHPPEAVQRNLALAADVAAELRDWPALVRCVELHRAAYTCFDDSQNNWREFRATYLALFGPKAFAERLLFDGRPTLSASEGLFACSLLDDAGGTAPWHEYLELHASEMDDTTSTPDVFDADGTLTPHEDEILTLAHGLVRVGEPRRVLRWLLRYLGDRGDAFHPVFTRRFAARLARILGVDVVERIARLAAKPRRLLLPRRAAAVLRLGIADEHARRDDLRGATDAASLALADADTPELVVACLSHGAPHPPALPAVEPTTLPIAVGPDENLSDATGVRAWVAAVRIWAADAAHRPALDDEARRVDGAGWYRSWLRFVLAVARVEADRRAGHSQDASSAFAELLRDAHPFLGRPRACDLWPIRNVIHESIAWGLRFLRTETEWRHSLQALGTASKKTASRLDREDGGPLPVGTLLDVLIPLVNDPVGGELVRHAIEEQTARLEGVGTYYPTHAELCLQLAAVRQATGDVAAARDAWGRGAVFLAAYGWRKDLTVFEIIESASALRSVSRDAALAALADSQPLTNAVLTHTDGRETKHAPNAWLESVLGVDPAVGIAVLARTLMEEDDQGGWPDVEAIHDAAEAARDVGDPALIDGLLATLRFEIEYRESAAKVADARLAPVLRLLAIDGTLAKQAFRRVAAEVTGDGRRYTEDAAAHVGSIAAQYGVSIPRIAPPENVEQSGQQSERHRRKPDDGTFRLPGMRLLPFPPRATFVDLLAGLRTVGAARRWEGAGTWDDVVLALGYHLGEIIDAGREDDALRLLRFFARDADIIASTDHPLGKVAASLDAAGYTRPASVAYALAYTATRGGGGWQRMGDKASAHLIQRAVALDAFTARQIVADEVAYSLRGSTYSIGISRNLVERLSGWGEPEVARDAWYQAFEVVRHRLPLPPGEGYFASLRIDREPEWPDQSWSVDQALVALLLARVEDPRLARKVTALAGVVRAILRRPETVAAPMRWWLTRSVHITSVLLTLDALESAEAAPYPITRAISDVLQDYAACDVWGARLLAKRLLERAELPVTSGALPSHAAMEGVGVDEPDPRRREVLLSADTGGVLDDLSPLIPELPGYVARRLHTLVAAKAQQDRVSARFKVAFGRDGDVVPPTPTLFWQVELFEMALHEGLCGLAERLWATGLWEAGIEDAVLRRVLPNTRLHIGLAASRTVRPEWPSPDAMLEGVGPLPTLGDDDPHYAGWTRLALIEDKYLEDPTRHSGEPVEMISVHCGAVAVPLAASIPPDASPFADGDVEQWWLCDRTPTRYPRISMGPQVQVAHVSDWLGKALVLIPPAALASLLALVPPQYGEPLVWRDMQGNPAVALRMWWIRNRNSAFAEPAACEGADLVIRPDVLNILRGRFGVPLQELRVLRRSPIRRDGEDAS